MNPLASLREPVVVALGWALVHVLWQGTLIALVLSLAHAALPRTNAHLRYGLACGAMALMVLSAASTFAWLRAAPLAGPIGSATGLTAAGASALAASGIGSLMPGVGLRARFAPWLQWLDAIWLAGVVVLSARSTVGWFAAQRLKTRNTTPVDPAWEQRARRLAALLGVSRTVRMSQSLLVRMPTVIGWLRPVILLPAGALAGVDARQLEALLAHELAHIRRHDYLANLLQTAAETLLFYHPAVWWVGRRIRIEREHCCDDLAVSACGDVLTYARALTRLEELRADGSQFAMAAGGGTLLLRVRRLIASRQPADHHAPMLLTAALVLLVAVGIWTGSLVASAGQPDTGSTQAQTTPVVAGQQSAPAQPKSFIGGLAEAGYKDLTVDELIAFKIHGVTPEFVGELRAAGMTGLTPDQLVAFRIHGVNAAEIREFHSAGLTALTPDQLVAFRIHRVTPQFVRGLKDAGLATITPDDAIAARIHSVTVDDVIAAVKAGLKNLTVERLIELMRSKLRTAEAR